MIILGEYVVFYRIIIMYAHCFNVGANSSHNKFKGRNIMQEYLP